MAITGIKLKKMEADPEKIEELAGGEFKDFVFDKKNAPQWKKIAVSDYKRANPKATDKMAFFAVETIVEPALRKLADTGHKRATGLDGKYLKYQQAYDAWKEQVYFPEKFKKNEVPSGDIREDYFNFQEDYQLRIDNAKNEIQTAIGTGNQEQARKLADKFESEFQGVDLGELKNQITAPSTVAQQPTAPTVRPPEQDPSRIAQQAVRDLGITPGTVTSLRADLARRPELEQMSPEFKEFITQNLEGIERATQETIKQIETGASRAGLSPFAQRAVTEAREAGEFEKTRTEAGLNLQDLERRMARFHQKEDQRRQFLEGQLGQFTQTQLNLAQMMQRRSDETEDQFRARTEALEDELRRQGFREAEIKNLQAFQTGQQFRQQGFNLQNIRQNQKFQLELYERQKRDFNEMLNRSKPQNVPFYQQALQAVGTGIGFAAAGPIGAGIGGQFAKMFGGGQKAPSTSFVTNPFSNLNLASSQQMPSFQSFAPKFSPMGTSTGSVPPTNVASLNFNKTIL